MTDIPIAVLDQLVRQQEEIEKLRQENERWRVQNEWLIHQLKQIKERIDVASNDRKPSPEVTPAGD